MNKVTSSPADNSHTKEEREYCIKQQCGNYISNNKHIYTHLTETARSPSISWRVNKAIAHVLSILRRLQDVNKKQRKQIKNLVAILVWREHKWWLHSPSTIWSTTKAIPHTLPIRTLPWHVLPCLSRYTKIVPQSHVQTLVKMTELWGGLGALSHQHHRHHLIIMTSWSCTTPYKTISA